MKAVRVDKEEYTKIFKSIHLVFNRPEFIEINEEKVQYIMYLLVYKEQSPRFAVALGVKEDSNAYCPFSAPFAYIESIKSGLGVRDYEEAVDALEIYFIENEIGKVTTILPPEFYDKRNINTWIQILLKRGWTIDYTDINFAFHLSDVSRDYMAKLARNAKKNLRIALGSNLKIFMCESLDEKREAYRIIQTNRRSKGYPLKMTEEQVLKTMCIVPSRMYIVCDEVENLAAALIYDVTSTVAQVVYWGDIPGHSEKKVMNYLAYELIKIYADRCFDFLDIGPSSENGVPNYGLCDFKDGIGCERNLKFKLSKCYRGV